MINFVNNGTDEAILKSMSTEECSEDLIKAMNKQGLVQKDVTVQGKNGKTFTRKQWVKASDVSKNSDTGVRTNTGDLQYKGKTISKTRRHGYVYYKIDGEKQLFSRESDAKLFIDKLSTTSTSQTKVSGQDKKNDNSVVTLSQQWQKKLEDALYSAPGTAADYAVGQVLKELPKGTVIKTGQKAMIASPPYELEVTYTKGDYDGWQYINKDYNTVYFNKVSNSICKVKDNSKFKLSVEVPNPTKDAQKTQATSQTIDKTSKSSNKKTLDTTYFESIKSDKAKALEYLKDCGVTWSENSHAGINWMRAMAAYKAATGGQKSTQKTQSSTPTQSTSQATTPTAQVAQNPQGNNGVKMSKEDAKKKTQSFTSKVGKTDAERKAFMDKVKSQGITWKDKADDGSDVAIGVSWMRCCMAMNKYFVEGGSFDETAKVNNIGSKNPYHNTPGFENVIPYHVDHTTTLNKFFDLSDSDEVYKGNSLDIQKLNQSIKSLADSWGITKGKMYAESSKDGKKTYLVCESKDGTKSRVYTYHNKMTKQQGFINSERKLDVFIHTKGNTLSDSEYDKLVNQACKDYISTLTPDKQKKANEFMPKRGTFVHWEHVKNILSIK